LHLKELYGIIYHYNYILNNYNIDDNEIITVNEVVNIWSIYFRESGVNPEQFRCCIQGGGIHYATGE